jgi:hypothetical protein
MCARYPIFNGIGFCCTLEYDARWCIYVAIFGCTFLWGYGATWITRTLGTRRRRSSCSYNVTYVQLLPRLR